MAGASIVLMGLYFLFLRPPLLPEDVRFMALTEGQLMAVASAFEMWLPWVFRVMGGFMIATGVLAITLGSTAFRAHDRVALVGASVGGLTSIGLMAVVNFIIGSDYKWLLLGLALLWACSLCLFWFEDAKWGWASRPWPWQAGRHH